MVTRPPQHTQTQRPCQGQLNAIKSVPVVWGPEWGLQWTAETWRVALIGRGNGQLSNHPTQRLDREVSFSPAEFADT